MGGRGELTDVAWAELAPRFTPRRRTGQIVGGPPRHQRRHPLEAADQCPVARPAQARRSLVDLSRPVDALATGRDLGPFARPGPDSVRRRGRGGRGGQYRQHRSPGASARRRGAERASSSEPADPSSPRGRPSPGGARTPPGRTDDQAAPGLRRPGPAAVSRVVRTRNFVSLLDGARGQRRIGDWTVLRGGDTRPPRGFPY